MRVASLILASFASITGLVFPFWLGRQATGLNQSILMLMMAGIAGAFIYGAGFRPKNQLLAWAITPSVTWPLTVGAFGLLVSIR